MSTDIANAPRTPDPGRAYAAAIAALNAREWAKALSLAGALLPVAKDHAGVHFVGGVAALQLNQIGQALQLLQRSVELNPLRADYRAQWARALAAGRSMREAVEESDRAAALETDDPLTLDTLGVVYSQANMHAKAAGMFRRAASLRPEMASFRFNLATSLTFGGDIAAADAEYEACIECDPRYWKAHLALAQLRRQTGDDNHLARLKELLNATGPDATGQMYLNLALSKELEDIGEEDASFDHLLAGKAAGRSLRPYDAQRERAVFEALEAAFPIPEEAADGYSSEEPIFVIGMPRSGTTLLDRILSSHPEVVSAGELPNFGTALKRASGSRTPALLDPDTLHRARSLDWKRLGHAYIASTRPGTGRTRHFIDKLPHNFLYAGHIARALPRARIVCLRRNPMDTCLSNFRQLFVQGSTYYDYSFDLLDTGRYYVLFDRLMAHWRRVLPGRILEVDYESIVDAQEQTTRNLLDFCGLPWDPACLKFEENEAPVATASAVQVRSPVYRNALGRWKRHAARLGDLRRLLEAEGIAVA